MSKIIFTDRYGGHPPSVKTICPGQCEGMGTVPIRKHERRQPWRRLWLEAEKVKPSEDGWHFVKCPTCGGTGKLKRS